MTLPDNVATWETELAWQRLAAEGAPFGAKGKIQKLDQCELAYLFTISHNGSMTPLEAWREINKKFPDEGNYRRLRCWWVCNKLRGLGLLDLLDKRKCRVTADTSIVYYATNSTEYVNVVRYVPKWKGEPFNTRAEALAFADNPENLKRKNWATGQSSGRLNRTTAKTSKQITITKKTVLDTLTEKADEAAYRRFLQIAPGDTILEQTAWASGMLLKFKKALADENLPAQMLAHVDGTIMGRPEVVDPERGQIVFRIEKYFPSLSPHSVATLKRANNFEPEHWRIVAATAFELQSNAIGELMDHGHILSAAERLDQPMPDKPRCVLENFTGTDEQGLLMAHFVIELRTLCESLAAAGCKLTDPAAWPARSRFLEQLSAVIDRYSDAQRWASLLYALSNENDWSAMFDGAVSRLLVVEPADWKEPRCFSPSYPVQRITGTDEQGTLIMKLIHRLQVACNFYGHAQVRFTENARDNQSVRQKFIQYLHRVFADEIKDRARWRATLDRLAQCEDWSTLLEPIEAAEPITATVP